MTAKAVTPQGRDEHSERVNPSSSDKKPPFLGGFFIIGERVNPSSSAFISFSKITNNFLSVRMSCNVAETEANKNVLFQNVNIGSDSQEIVECVQPLMKRVRNNPIAGEFRQPPCCGAKIRNKSGITYKQVAMVSGRCYFLDGKCTGPRTEKRLEQMKKAKTKYGYYTKERINERRCLRKKLNQAKEELKNISKEI